MMRASGSPTFRLFSFRSCFLYLLSLAVGQPNVSTRIKQSNGCPPHPLHSERCIPCEASAQLLLPSYRLTASVNFTRLPL